MDSTVELTRELIRRPSVTPDDAGCQELIAERLAAAGFDVERMRFGEVDNLWAVAGDSGPLLCLLGHTDVVPPGPREDWSGDPFEPRLEDGLLYGRGAADMKGGVAAMITACERFRAAHPEHAGRLAVLLTSDEEGPALDGTRRVIETLLERDQRIDWCLVGEPSSQETLGDTVKNGRRGSLTAYISVYGRQGHVAYPQTADNALHRLLAALAELIALEWEDEDAHFQPTSLQVSDLTAGTGADNVIPGRAEATLNLRFPPARTGEDIRWRVSGIIARHAPDHRIDWHPSGEPFLTPEGGLLDAVRAAVVGVTSRMPELSTEGGTSDGRFVAPTGAQVVELGPINASIHQADEHVRADDLVTLARIYESVIERLLVTG